MLIIFQKSKFAIRERVIEFALEKKDAGPYWDRLVKEKNKYHWLKTDFNKWKDEDESEDEEGGQDLEEVTFFCKYRFKLSLFRGFYATKQP
jgi:hypothetical protein